MSRFDLARRRMVESQLMARGIRDKGVLDAMRKIPRHLFVEEALQDQAYGDHALPIGERQTISQAYMVALMSEALALNGSEKVLEVGTGSAYQTAVLAELAEHVYSLERIDLFIEKTKVLMKDLGYENVCIRCADGTVGWEEEAPFDAILVTAGAPEIPQALIAQLAIGGRLVIPVGDRVSQVLKKIVKQKTGATETSLTSCTFVPLVGEAGWQYGKGEAGDQPNTFCILEK
ncbi:Protein-L-isoaspartate O-methyltransferase [hydrothermal vent metagenome]|uniref:protein-L-isoaspartate(D-aspartate) O-methyltransferase n=1 Tax=hydrothermal vent metagenome TaxID=652676 RepID=A0A3B1CUR6_9ZZZZ